MAYSSATGIGCRSKLTATSHGVAVLDATTIVIHREGGTQTTSVCGGGSSQKPIPPATLRYTYTLDTSGDVPLLNLRRNDGDAPPGLSDAPSSVRR
ncbi:MAG: hypothetical protein KIS78_11145 [Labilithrix sp.]|nr:hypothetical protein [Labilithrix sp.]